MGLTNKRFSASRVLVAASEDNPPLMKGAKGEAVAIVQQALLDLGFAMPISTAGGSLPDGTFGAETDATVRAFQRSKGLQIDGIVGRDTLKQLEESIRSLSQVEEARFTATFLSESRKGGMVG